LPRPPNNRSTTTNKISQCHQLPIPIRALLSVTRADYRRMTLGLQQAAARYFD
jgi:hypothetical protein